MNHTSSSSGPAVRQTTTITAWGVVLAGFLAVFLDGFDAASLAITVPALSKEWGTTPASFTLPLVLTNLGVVVGYMSAGWLGARWGRRKLLLTGIATFALLTVLVAATLPLHSMPLLSVLRVGTGIGLGIVLPTAVALAAQHSTAPRRQLVSVVVVIGLVFGSAAGGFAGGTLIQTVGMAGVFWVAGILPLVLLVVAPLMIPKHSVQVSEAKDKAKISRLFTPELRSHTLVLWVFAFVIFVASYTLSSWTPTLLSGYGFSPTEAPLGLAFLSLGGVIGSIALIPLAGRFGTPVVLVAFAMLATLSILAAALLPLGKTGLLIALGLAGAGITAGLTGQLTIAVALYPDLTRTTGVGWAAALGRVGSILGPAIAGALLALNFSGRSIFLSTTVPVVLAGAAALVLWYRLRGRQTDEQASELESKAPSQ